MWLVASPIDGMRADDWDVPAGVIEAWDDTGAAYETYAELVGMDGSIGLYPVTLVIDADGTIAFSQTSRDPAALEALLELLVP
jgi:hypothetical protein